MSYILDALRRAENERERGQVPGLNAQPAPGRATATPTRPMAVVPALALGLGLLLLAGLAWWVWPQGTAPTPGGATTAAVAPPAVTAPAVAEPTPAASASGPVAPPEPLRPLPLPVVVSAPPPPPPPPPAPSPAVQVPAPSAPSLSPTVALAELTAQQRRDWPPLVLGGVVHSDNPASRFIIVNGQLVHEGEEAAPGVMLERIDARAAILRWRDLRVEMPL